MPGQTAGHFHLHNSERELAVALSAYCNFTPVLNTCPLSKSSSMT